MATKIVKSLKFPNSTDTYQINAVALEGKSLADIQAQLDDEVDTAIDELKPLIGTTAEITPAQVKVAIEAGKDVTLTYSNGNFGAVVFSNFDVVGAGGFVSATAFIIAEADFRMSLFGDISSGQWYYSEMPYMDPANYYVSYVVDDKLALMESNFGNAISNMAPKSESLAGYGITDAYTKTEVDNKLSTSGGGKFDQHCWLKEGYSYYNYDTTPSWSTQSTAVTLTDPFMSTPYITLCTNLTITEANGKVKFSGNVRHLYVSYYLTTDDIGDPIWEISINDSADQVEDINDLVSLLENYDDGAGYVITGLNEDPSKVSSTDTLSATNLQVAQGTVNIYQMRNKGSSAIGVTSDSAMTGPGTGVYAYYESIELLANSLKKLNAPTAGEIVDTYEGVREVVYSSTSDAYTEGDNGAGLIYTYYGIPSESLPLIKDERSYTGTGSTTVSLIFEQRPSCIQIISDSNGVYTGTIFPVQGVASFRLRTGSTGANATGHKTCDAYYCTVTCTLQSDGTYKVSWGSGYCNTSGAKYYYVTQ